MKKRRQAKQTYPATFRNWIFVPPYYGVPWLVWLYAFICLFTGTHGNGVWTGHLIGFDDQVRMTQVLNWVNGAGWYDRDIMRVNAPEGFHSIWSRIVDIPLAAVVVIAQQFVPQKTAALISSIVVCYAELAILFVVMIYLGRPLVGRSNARLAILFLMFTTVLNQKRYTFAGFHPGEASHHSWYVILNVLMFGAAARVAIGAGGRKPAVMLGLAIALLVAVGIEGFPMIAGCVAVLAITAWAFNDSGIARRGAFGVASGAALSLLMLPMNQSPGQLFDVSFAEPSILGPILVGAAALYLALEVFVLNKLGRQKVVGAIAMIFLACVFAGALVSVFPKIMEGPAAALSVAEREMAHEQHPEARPMIMVADGKLEYLEFIAPALIALTGGVYAMRRSRSRRRKILYAAYLGHISVAFGMSQMLWRYVHHAMMACCPWLVWVWERLKERLPKNRNYNFAALGLFVLLGPFWMLLLPAITNNMPSRSLVLFFPDKVQVMQDDCNILPFAAYLNSHYGKDTLLMVPDWDSAKFLYNTDLRIDFLANYPSQDKFIENMGFFQTQNDAFARQIAVRHDFDLVAICNLLPISQELSGTRPMRKAMMMERLAFEGNPPDWLKPVDTGVQGRYQLYRVDKKLLRAEQR